MNIVKIYWVAHAELCHPLHTLLAYVNVEGLFFFLPGSKEIGKVWDGVLSGPPLKVFFTSQ